MIKTHISHQNPMKRCYTKTELNETERDEQCLAWALHPYLHSGERRMSFDRPSRPTRCERRARCHSSYYRSEKFSIHAQFSGYLCCCSLSCSSPPVRGL